MRVWEFEEKKEALSDLVLEQDFILRVRRMQRSGTPTLVLNFILSAIDALKADEKARKAVQEKLKAFAASTAGTFHEMSNGDCFLVWQNAGEARLIAARAIEAALPQFADNTNIYLLTFRMPENYAILRERTNEYVEQARALATVEAGDEKVDESSGRLNAKNVLQIEKLLEEIDVRNYIRTQSIYRDDQGVWTPVAEEFFIGFDTLRRERFPKVEIMASEHFFFAICSVLDQKWLTALANTYEQIEGRLINFNLSISSIMGSAFTQFVRRVPKEQRNLIGFELNRGDLLQDFSLTLTAIEALKREGFRVALDSITPNVVPYLSLDKLNVDRIKITASKEFTDQLKDPALLAAIHALPSEKLIFFRCDNEFSLALGRQLGVKLFQGWLIDDLATKKP